MPRTLRLALLALALAAVVPSQAAAFRTIHHGDPFRAFPKGKARPVAHASALGPFATDWPCDEALADLGEQHSNAPQVKVLYIRPNNVSDSIATYGTLMQKDADAVRNKVAASGRSVRFDVGGTGGTCTATASQHLDIQTIQLANTKLVYNVPQAFTRVTDELRAILPRPSGGRRVNYVVYADQISPGSLIAGEADIPQDDSHDPLNTSNQGRDGDGRLFALVYGSGDPSDFTGHGESARQATFCTR